MLASDDRIFLIGPMGAGKSAIGKRLAELLRLNFFDSDQLLEQKQQTSIAHIINNFGEAYFRTQEQVLIATLSLQPKIVLATGGGCILAAQTRELLAIRGLVCYLKASPETQIQRLKFDQTRPLLPSGIDRLASLQKMAKTRDYLYAEIADIILDTDHVSVELLAWQLASAIFTSAKHY